MKKGNGAGKKESADIGIQTRVLLESMRQEVTTVAEGHSILVMRIKKLEGDLRVLQESLISTQKESGTFRNIVFDINQQLNNHNGRIAELESNLRNK